MTEASPGPSGTPSGDAGRRSKPSKILPTDRIAFDRQLDILRAYAAASGPSCIAVTNKDVASIVRMASSTVGYTNTFFVENGFLTKLDNGFVPVEEVFAFSRAYEWNPETATHRLAPIVMRSWFGQVILPRVSFDAIPVGEAIQVLADACNAGTDFKKQIELLLDFVLAAGVNERDGTSIKKAALARPTAEPKRQEPERESLRPSVNTMFTQPTEGVVQFHVSVKVDMAEFAGWKPDRISAFFGGIARVLAAKSQLERDASEE